jgi:hypothetical protein
VVLLFGLNIEAAPLSPEIPALRFAASRKRNKLELPASLPSKPLQLSSSPEERRIPSSEHFLSTARQHVENRQYLVAVAV